MNEPQRQQSRAQLHRRRRRRRGAGLGSLALAPGLHLIQVSQANRSDRAGEAASKLQCAGAC